MFTQEETRAHQHKKITLTSPVAFRLTFRSSCFCMSPLCLTLRPGFLIIYIWFVVLLVLAPKHGVKYGCNALTYLVLTDELHVTKSGLEYVEGCLGRAKCTRRMEPKKNMQYVGMQGKDSYLHNKENTRTLFSIANWERIVVTWSAILERNEKREKGRVHGKV